VGLALGGQLFAQDDDQLRFIVRPIAVGRRGQYDVHPTSLPLRVQGTAFDAVAYRAFAYTELAGGLRYG
jgi:hypothetical protein